VRPITTILALDGGGVRGLMTALWLERLERSLGSLRSHFDLVAGTSAGAINACALVKGLPARDVVELYEERGRGIFPGTASRLWSRLGRTFTQGLSAPKYSGEGLEQALRAELGAVTLGELSGRSPRLLIPTYDVVHRQGVVIKTHHSGYSHLPLWSVAKASASAPTYFPAHVLSTREGGVERRRALIDGGVVANNPTACAVAEAIRINRELGAGPATDRFLVVSVGTGRPPNDISVGKAKAMGIAQWAPALVGVFMGGADEATDYVARQLLAAGTYIRLQIDLPEYLSALDDASDANLKALKRRAIEALDEGPVRDAMARVLEAFASRRAA
jgi:predicted acylesterase/phospholipase RssA